MKFDHPYRSAKKIVMMKTFLIFSASLLLVSSSFAQWSVLSVSSVEMEKQTSRVSKDFWLHITIKNDSEEPLYIWGQRGFHIVEAFIQNAESQVWERQNMGICGTMGEPSWQQVKAGQEIKLLRREAVEDIGKSMMLTFQASTRPDGMRRNSEVLLGAFKIPEFGANKAEQGGVDQPAGDVPGKILIQTKFVEVDSGTEEFGFDWLLEQSSASLNKAEQVGADQPAAAPKSKSESNEKP